MAQRQRQPSLCCEETCSFSLSWLPQRLLAPKYKACRSGGALGKKRDRKAAKRNYVHCSTRQFLHFLKTSLHLSLRLQHYCSDEWDTNTIPKLISWLCWTLNQAQAFPQATKREDNRFMAAFTFIEIKADYLPNSLGVRLDSLTRFYFMVDEVGLCEISILGFQDVLYTIANTVY